MWDFMATRELDATIAHDFQSARGSAIDTECREERCCVIYEEALKSLNTGIIYNLFSLDMFHSNSFQLQQ